MNQFEDSTTQEKVFNLQLTIQKLEEELQLYRNGTSVTELLELIHEKDVEIETLTLQNEEKANKLKKLAKTSGEVLVKYENLQIELQDKQDMIYDMQQAIQELDKSLKEKEEYIEKEIKVNQKRNQELLAIKDSQIGELELKLWELNEESKKNIEEKESTIKQLEEKCEQQVATISTLKEELRESEEEKNQLSHNFKLQETETPLLKQQIASLEGLVEKQKKIIEDSDTNILNLQKRCSTLVNEQREKQRLLDVERQQMIKNIQEFRDSMNLQLSQREESVRRKDDKIRELNLRISVLQQSHKASSVAPSSSSDKENVLNL